ncbi:hypothetical protein ACFQ5J_05365 [Lacticaseibacillus baoqingensis]|uniref:Uncharacterized protein n=1 Tax=Lacticaseibacillus baoqingensis TaxID=2486013 RepID=A0ABW4E5X2_9LACO|nr:hypothetical protein [Lacticaseibacillus baoqingensis]
MRLFDESFTAEATAQKTSEALKLQHAYNVQQAIQMASYHGRNEITLAYVTDEELKELIISGFETDEVGGSKTWIHWEQKATSGN